MSRRLTRRSAALIGGAALLFLVGTNVQAGWVLAVAALLLGVLVAGILLPLRGLRDVEVTRRPPRSAVAGDDLVVHLDVTNSGASVRGLLRLDDRFCGEGTAVVGLLVPGQTRSYVTKRTEARRGVHSVGECRLTTGAPFGAMTVARTDEVSSTIVVYPRTYRIGRRRAAGAGGWQAPAAVGDVSSVREYRPGDELRHIHWRSVARRGRLMVREFDRERHTRTAVLAVVPHDRDVADAVSSIACSIAIDALSEGDVALISSAGSTTVRAADRVLDWGARLEPDAAPFPRFGSIGLSRVAVVAAPDAVRLANTAPDGSIAAVVVGEDAEGAVTRLRATGARAAAVGVDQVEAWFRDGCEIS